MIKCDVNYRPLKQKKIQNIIFDLRQKNPQYNICDFFNSIFFKDQYRAIE